MATKFVTFTGKGYIPDWDPAAKDLEFQGRFNQPPVMSDAMAANILGTLGLTLKSKTTEPVCKPPSSFMPRKLKFSFASGGSIAVPVKDRANLISIATTLKTDLAQMLGSTVVCIELIGEQWTRMDEEFRPVGVVPTPGTDIRPSSGTKNPTYSASMSYSSDGGKVIAQSVRMNTDDLTGASAFSGYKVEIDSALGTLLPKGCGGGSNIAPRHYTVDFLTTNTANPVRQLIVPVASSSGITGIRTTGAGLAAITQTLCLKYNGESDARFSRLIP